MKKENYEFVRYISNNSDSRWADPEEIKNAPTISCLNIEADDCPSQKGGIPIISDGNSTYVDYTDTHTIIFGSTGSKKTRLFGMPLINILALTGESFIATDPKGELYKKTSGLVAEKGYKTIVLNLRDLKYSDFWNPLALPHSIYHNGQIDEAISLLNDFLNAVAEPHRKGKGDPYFSELAFQLALAHLLFFIETASPEEANIYNFAKFCATENTSEAITRLSSHVVKDSIAHTNYKGVIANEGTNTLKNIVAGVSAFINAFVIQKSLCQVLSHSSFDVREIGKTKTAIYIIVPDEKTTLHFLVTAFIKQTYESLIYEAQQQQNNQLPIRVNFVLDEFANIPAIPDMPAMISAARSRNMRFFLMAQGMRQLSGKYGDDAHTIRGNCDNWVFLTSREKELLEEISDLCGSNFYRDSDDRLNQKPLISTSELQRLKKECGETLILHRRNYPFVTELPDIDEYKFKHYEPIKINDRKLPEIIRYEVSKVFDSIKNNKRAVPFSVEVFGKEKFFEDFNENPKKNDIFDW